MRIVKVFQNTLKFVSVSLMVGIVGSIFIQVILRYVFNISLPWIEEFAVWSLVWLIFLGSAIAVLENAHPKVEFLLNALPNKIRYIMQIGIHLICSLVILVLMYYTIPLLKLNQYNISASLGISFSVLYLSFIVGGALMVLFFTSKMLEDIKSLMKEGNKT